MLCERERQRGKDGNTKTLMMKNSPNSQLLWACGMMGYTEIKLQILMAKPLKVK